MTDDIVARLRVWSDWLNERCPDTEVRNDLRAAADEIERLRAVVEAWKTYSSRAERDIAELREERDEARWRLCKVVGDNRNVWGCVIAKENGWDYLATEETEATDVRG